MSEEEADKGEEERVGYKQPPKRHQFKKGVSGNPRGRPKMQRRRKSPPPNAMRVAERLWLESRRPVTVREDGRQIEIPLIDAILRNAGVKALQGPPRDQIAYAKLVEKAEEMLAARWQAKVDDVLEYKHMYRSIFEEHDRHGKARPTPIPHPDDIVIDYKNNEIIYNGPRDEIEAEAWKEKKLHRDDLVEEIDYMRQFCLKNGYGLKKYWDLFKLNKATIVIHDGIFPNEAIRRKPGFNLDAWRRANGVLEKLEREGRKAFEVAWDDAEWVRQRPRLGVKLKPYKDDN